ncbi:biotin synthase [Legionella birminghamensis]|uniref:Malonyl-[acyl-carrier protein] O-methyltransferase n=1 Tax=Legionella birminghamensis TaxID=28083 RepID=A0A378ICM1_9GAMM|nr:malonyl-ACP O-methyltransferase BioC [Legionella birminghamensis]KTC74302.1 biotin synthase [Legionella birminghamensis]STX32580.1 biotin synthase [Legionella birminghamensis]
MNPNIEVCNAFNRHAAEYEQAAKIQNEIGQRLFDRLSFLKITPRYVLDLGSGTGLFTAQLKKKYPNAQIIGLDLAYGMLLQARQKQRLWRKWPLVNADMMKLPFADRVFDLVFANQVVHWSQPPLAVFKELNRVMNVNGCLMFSTLGPDTFKELRSSWNSADSYAHTNEFADMHDVGDELLRQGFLDPVIDMELLTVHYKSITQLVSNLKSQGVRNINPMRNHGLTGCKAWKKFEENYQTFCTENNKYPLSYEVVYGHSWKGERHRDDEVFIPVSQIRKAQRKI